MGMNKALGVLMDLIYGKQSKCCLCGRSVVANEICDFCYEETNDLKRNYSSCQVCGRLLNQGNTCYGCKRGPVSFKYVFSVGPYDGMLKDRIYQFKYGGRRDLAKGFSKLMADNISSFCNFREFGLIVPVPLYWKKQSERNYNQSYLLARELANRTKIPLGKAALIKVNDTPSQTSLNREKRRSNLVDAFRVGNIGVLAGKRVLLVDDIVTTGSTVSECTRVLLEAGVSEVWVSCIAMAIDNREKKTTNDIVSAIVD